MRMGWKERQTHTNPDKSCLDLPHLPYFLTSPHFIFIIHLFSEKARALTKNNQSICEFSDNKKATSVKSSECRVYIVPSSEFRGMDEKLRFSFYKLSAAAQGEWKWCCPLRRSASIICGEKRQLFLFLSALGTRHLALIIRIRKIPSHYQS